MRITNPYTQNTVNCSEVTRRLRQDKSAVPTPRPASHPNCWGLWKAAEATPGKARYKHRKKQESHSNVTSLSLVASGEVDMLRAAPEDLPGHSRGARCLSDLPERHSRIWGRNQKSEFLQSPSDSNAWPGVRSTSLGDKKGHRESCQVAGSQSQDKHNTSPPPAQGHRGTPTEAQNTES